MPKKAENIIPRRGTCGGDLVCIVAKYDDGSERILSGQEIAEVSWQAEYCKLRAVVDKVARLTGEICEHRELSDCWFVHDDPGDCGNWPNCHPHCPLKQLRDIAGFVPQEDGGLNKQPSTREAAENAKAH